MDGKCVASVITWQNKFVGNVMHLFAVKVLNVLYQHLKSCTRFLEYGGAMPLKTFITKWKNSFLPFNYMEHENILIIVVVDVAGYEHDNIFM